MRVLARLREALAARRATGLYRRRRLRTGAAHPVQEIDGRRVVSFCGNDYLGLAAEPRVARALAQGAERWGAGSGASTLVNGYTTAHAALETALAAFVQRPAALLFPSGYMANLAVATALAGRGDRVFLDRLAHASLIDAARLCGARWRRYPHGETTALTRWLEHDGGGRSLVLTDGLFSMDGDLAPLTGLATCCTAQEAWLVVDDAHGLGVLGASGRGTLEHHGLSMREVPILVGTLGKAFGTAGAFVSGEADLIEVLVQFARTQIYTTAPPPALAEATLESLAIMDAESWRRERLHTLIARFRAGAAARGLPLLPVTGPIQPLIVGDSAAALALSERLLERGLFVAAIRPPTVPQGSARLRVTFSALHEDAQVEALLDALTAEWPRDA